jgi:Bacterial membrane protein YfhO
VLAARRLAVPATVAGLLAVGAYAWVVIAPSAGLPERLEVDAPPRHMVWLRQAAGHEYRAFGIYPDYSSVGEIQDVEVVGPLATNAWVAFVDLVSSPPVARGHRTGSTFSLARQRESPFWYDLTTDYPRARPLLDWAGVRFLVLDKAVFGGRRTDHRALLEPSSGLRVAYEDDVVTIVESPTARSKAYFTSNVREESAATTLARLQADPQAVEDLITVEEDVGDVAVGRGDGPSVPVPLTEYRPNGLRATFEAPAPGIFVVTDSYFPGWQATVNGQPAEVIQVNGLVRGVVVPAAGRQEVTMSYRPASFANGVTIATAALALLLALIGWDRLGVWKGPLRRVSRPEPALATRSSATTRPASAQGGQAVGP